MNLKKPNHMFQEGGHISVKEAVLPFARFPGVDTILGPEMRSTGEVMGIDENFGRAFAKSQIGAGVKLPTSGTVFISVREADKDLIEAPARALVEMGFRPDRHPRHRQGVGSRRPEGGGGQQGAGGSPACGGFALKNGAIHLVFNTTDGQQALIDSSSIRRAALTLKVPYYTTMAGAAAAIQAIQALRAGSLEVAPLQSYSL